MHPDGSERKEIGRGAGRRSIGGESSARFSPDGKQIAYVGTNNTVWITDLEGAHPAQVMAGDPEGRHVPTDVCWSPDGKWLAIRTMNTTKRMTASVPADDRIEFFAADGKPHGELKLKNVDTLFMIEELDWR